MVPVWLYHNVWLWWQSTRQRLWLQHTFFTRNSDHEQTDFHTDNRVTRFTNWFHSVDFYAEIETSLKYQLVPTTNLSSESLPRRRFFKCKSGPKSAKKIMHQNLVNFCTQCKAFIASIFYCKRCPPKMTQNDWQAMTGNWDHYSWQEPPPILFLLSQLRDAHNEYLCKNIVTWGALDGGCSKKEAELGCVKWMYLWGRIRTCDFDLRLQLRMRFLLLHTTKS